MKILCLVLFLLGISCSVHASICDVRDMTTRELGSFEHYFQLAEHETVEIILSRYDQCKDQAKLVLAYLYLDAEFPFTSILKAVSYLEQSVEMGNEQAAALLGSLYLFDDRVYNLEEGIELLEFASSKGVNLAMINLFTLSMQGKYDSDKGVRFLETAYKNGHEKAALYYGYHLHLKSVSTGQHGLTSDAINVLEGFNFTSLSGDRHFYLVEIYMDKRTPHYDSAVAVRHWKKAIDQGHEQAIRLWRDYERAVQK